MKKVSSRTVMMGGSRDRVGKRNVSEPSVRFDAELLGQDLIRASSRFLHTTFMEHLHNTLINIRSHLSITTAELHKGGTARSLRCRQVFSVAVFNVGLWRLVWCLCELCSGMVIVVQYVSVW